MQFRHLLSVLALGLAGPAMAQNFDPNQSGAAAQANLNTLTTGAPTMLPNGSSDGLKGSPYADDRWRLTQITLSNKLPLAPVPVKYDVLSQRLIMHKPAPSPDSLQLDDRLMQQFVLLAPTTGLPARPRTFRRFAEAPEPTHRTDFVEVLHEGRYTLLERHQKKMQKAALQGAYNSGQRFDEITDQTEYFLRTPEGRIVPIKQMSLKALQSAAPALTAELKTAAASLRPKTDDDWAALLDSADPATK